MSIILNYPPPYIECQVIFLIILLSRFRIDITNNKSCNYLLCDHINILAVSTAS